MDTQRRVLKLFLKAFFHIHYLCDLYPPYKTFVAACFKTKQYSNNEALLSSEHTVQEKSMMTRKTMFR